MQPTLNELIEAAIRGTDQDVAHSGRVEVEKKAAAAPPSQDDSVEKLASALEFVGRRGVLTVLGIEKQAAAPETDDGKNTRAKNNQSQVAPNKASPPMSASEGGLPENDANRSVTGKQEHLSGTGQTHHPALASNQAAIDLKKSEHARNVGGDLSKLLRATPFADPKARENLDHASEAGEVNVNVGKGKAASASEITVQMVKDEIARRIADGQGGVA